MQLCCKCSERLTESMLYAKFASATSVASVNNKVAARIKGKDDTQEQYSIAMQQIAAMGSMNMWKRFRKT